MKKFKASHFDGDCTIDEDFEVTLTRINEIAQKYNITVLVTSSYRIDANVKGAIVTPATHSNHMIGHAIDCNLKHEGAVYNSTRMQNDKDLIRKFINEVKAAGIRWGGDFGKPDPVHFDDGLNLKDMTVWTAKYQKLHGGDNSNMA
jgi:hypothetical protein